MNAKIDHLSRLESGDETTSLDDNLPDAQLFSIKMIDDHYQYIVHLLTIGYAPEGSNPT